MSPEVVRQARLLHYIWHLECCAYCQDALHFGRGFQLCPNGVTLRAAAEVSPLPELEKMPPGTEPSGRYIGDAEFRPADLKAEAKARN